jgi:hypothetical protein
MRPTIARSVLPHAGAVLILVGLAVAYFRPQLEGKVVPQGDMIQHRGMAQEIVRVQDQTGERPLWTNSMFGGMPSYQITTPDHGNGLRVLHTVLSLGLDHPLGAFLPAMLSFYVLMIALGTDVWLAAIGAFAFAFTTNNLTLYEAGHISKLRAVAYFPLVAAGMVLAYRGRYAWGGLIFAVGLGLNIMANHVQMTYYLALTIPVFLVAELIADLRAGRIAHFARASAVLLLAAVFAAGSSAALLWMTLEYSRETVRGAAVLAGRPDAGTDHGAGRSGADGLSWDYAMQWSNGPIDLVASLVPGAAGGGSDERLGEHSAIARELRASGHQVPANARFPLYWGELPFTSGPIYFGASVLLLFVMGLFLVKGPVKWWLAIGTLVTVLLSMGRHLEGFNEFVFAHVPLYNRFRTPNSALAVAAFLIPMLGLLALDRVVRGEARKPDVTRSLLAGVGILGGISLFLFLLGGSIFDVSHPQDAGHRHLERAMLADRLALLQRDALRSLLLVVSAGGAIWAFAHGRIGRRLLVAGIGVIVVVDVWMVDRRYVSPDTFVDRATIDEAFRPRPVDVRILQDPDPSYRVLDLTVNTYESAQYSYFHKMIGGYHAAKLRRYQDLMERHLVNGNRAVLDMLNTRYVIIRGPGGQPEVRRNPTASGNAWFVDRIRMVDTPNEEIEALADFDPATVAVVHREFSGEVAGLGPSAARGTIQLRGYRPDHLTYRSESPQEALAVFSEVWYGPDKGWHAYVDGAPAALIRANYALRALRVPAGQHEIELVFKPAAFHTGRTISRVFSGLTVLGLVGFAGHRGYRRMREAARR